MVLLFQKIGSDVRTCDAKCYDAKHPDCDCICGGINHGVGFAVALQNTRDVLDDAVQKPMWKELAA